MTTKTITLPDEMAKAAETAGLFEPERFKMIMQVALRATGKKSFWEGIDAINNQGHNLNDEEIMSMVEDEIHETRKNNPELK